jgi:hypothetical protein
VGNNEKRYNKDSVCRNAVFEISQKCARMDSIRNVEI